MQQQGTFALAVQALQMCRNGTSAAIEVGVREYRFFAFMIAQEAENGAIGESVSLCPKHLDQIR